MRPPLGTRTPDPRTFSACEPEDRPTSLCLTDRLRGSPPGDSEAVRAPVASWRRKDTGSPPLTDALTHTYPTPPASALARPGNRTYVCAGGGLPPNGAGIESDPGRGFAPTGRGSSLGSGRLTGLGGGVTLPGSSGNPALFDQRVHRGLGSFRWPSRGRKSRW
jgi:hypothetical protein